jgi:NDP-sugar pyrophosphorylase family protein
VDAVVMAAGEGRRLRPLTERWAKPVLPVDGRPVLATLLRELVDARPETVWLVTGHLAEQVEALAGDGSAFGLPVRTVRQPEPLGSADAVRRALDAGAAPPLLVAGADTVFAPGDLAAARDAWEASGAAGGLGVRPLAPKEVGERTRVRAEDGRLAAFGQETHTADGAVLTGAPLWFLSASLADRIAAVPGPPFELAAAFEAALADGDDVAALPLGPTRDLTRPADLVARNFPYLSGWGR